MSVTRDHRQVLGERLDALFRSGVTGAPATVLDVGCGPGWGAHAVYQHLMRHHDPERSWLYCFDLEPAAAAATRRVLAEHGYRRASVLTADVFRLPFDDAALDYVTALNVMHHLSLRSFAGEMHRVLKPAGRLLIYSRNPKLNMFRFSLTLGREQLGLMERAGTGAPPPPEPPRPPQPPSVRAG